MTPWPDAESVGGRWNRQFNPDVGLIGSDRAPVARHVCFAGSVTWLATPFDRHDMVELARAAAFVPGWSPGQTDLAAVSLSGFSADAGGPELRLRWGPGNVIAASAAG